MMSPSRAPQTYEGEEVTVTFDPGLCIHSEECVHGLPAVFDPSRKRWIRPDEASADPEPCGTRSVAESGAADAA